jgi:hypothetical protein
MNRALASLAPLVPIAVLALSSPALAGSPVRLAYEAPEGCPAQPDFVAAVTARGGDFDGEGSASSHRVMVVAIRKDGRGFDGAFQVRDDETATNKREVHGPSCSEVVDALAVVTAIALRSDADAAAAAPVADVTPPAAPPTEPPSQPKTPVESPPEERFRGNTRVFPPRTEKIEVGAGTLRLDLQRSFTLTAGAVVGLIPSVIVPDYDLSLVVAPFVTTPEGAQRIPGPVFRLHVGLMFPPTYRTADTSTDLSGGSFGIGLCQSPLYDTRGLVLLVCFDYGGGFMTMVTKGTDGSQIQSKTEGYAEVTFGGDIQYNLGSHFLVGARVGGSANLGTLSAERADGTRIFGTPTDGIFFSAYALLGIGLHW